MNMKPMRLTGAILAVIPLLLSGCGDMKLKVWPFGSDETKIHSRAPVDAVEYQCEGNKKFFVRTLEGGASVWLILREREVRLDRMGADGGSRYTNGIAVLELNGNAATLTDGAAASYVNCKTGASQ